MEWKYIIVLTILLISAMSMAGCTGTSPAPVATPAPVPAATSVPAMAPVATASPVPPAVTWPALETPATGHPYSKTYSFHGSGTYQDFTFTTDSDAPWSIRMDPGGGYFLVILKDARGQQMEVLADGPAAGTKSVWLRAGDYAFDITADSPWYITMTTP